MARTSQRMCRSGERARPAAGAQSARAASREVAKEAVGVTSEVFTLSVWRAKPGRESDLQQAWRELADAFAELPEPPGEGTLLQSLDDSSLHYSFGTWPSLRAVVAMRGSESVRNAVAALGALCDEATPGAFRVVARSAPPPVGRHAARVEALAQQPALAGAVDFSWTEYYGD